MSGMTIEGEAPKRYRISYSGTAIWERSWDAASEALREYLQFADIIKSRGELEKPAHFLIRDNDTKIAVADLIRAAEKENQT